MKVLVATDVAARGVHVDNIELVIHVDPPAEHKAYLHRSGRTARAGEEGDVVTIVLPTQRKDTAALLRKAAITVTPQHVNAKSEAVVALTGEVAEYVKPAPRAAVPARGQSQGGRSQGANAQRKRSRRGGEGAGFYEGERDGAREGGRGGAGGRGGNGGGGARGGRNGAARDGARDGARGGQQRNDRQGSGRGAVVAGSGSSEQRSTQQPRQQQAEAPTRPRGGKGRAQAGSGPVRVGQVVRPNRRASSSGR